MTFSYNASAGFHLLLLVEGPLRGTKEHLSQEEVSESLCVTSCLNKQRGKKVGYYYINLSVDKLLLGEMT